PVVAPARVGDASLSEPLIALLRERFGAPMIDVLAPPWCAPVYARVRGVRDVIENPMPHGRFDWSVRRELGRSLRRRDAHGGYDRAYVLPNSWKSALVPWFARIPNRVGYRGEARFGLLTDVRRLNRKAMPRLADRFAALAVDRNAARPSTPAPVLVADADNRRHAAAAMALDLEKPVAILCPGAEYGPAKRWPAEHFATLARRFLEHGLQVWL